MATERAVTWFRPQRRSEYLMALAERIRCKLCGAWRIALARHLRFAHEIAAAEYKRRFGVYRLIAPRLSVRLGKVAVRRGWGRMVWTDERFLRRLRRAARQGTDLALAAVRSEHPAWISLAYTRFGSWPGALRAAGIDGEKYRRRRRWTPGKVLEAIRTRRRAGEPLNAAAVERSDSALLTVARSRFGSWAKALAAAGIAHDQVRLRAPAHPWTREQVLAEIRRRAAAGRRVIPPERATAGGLSQAVRRRFRTWRRALTAAGLDYRDHYGKLRNRWTRARVLAALRAERAAGRSLQPVDVKRRWPSLYNAIHNYVPGHWGGALRAIGLDPQEFAHVRRWSRSRVRQAIRARAESGLSLRNTDVKKNDLPLWGAGANYFGCWTKAVAAAGEAYPAPTPRRGAWSRERILASIRSEVAAGRRVEPRRMRRENASLDRAIGRHFPGGWRSALLAAGLQPEDHMRVSWTKALVVTTIRSRAEQGKSLGSEAVFREERGLMGAAVRWFGSWKAAVRKLGFTYRGVERPVVGVWTRKRILTALREMVRDGRTNLRQDLERRNRGLYRAVYRLFPGGFGGALRAAGCGGKSARGR